MALFVVGAARIFVPVAIGGSIYRISHCHDVTSMVQKLRDIKNVFPQHLGCIVLSLLCAVILTMCHTAHIIYMFVVSQCEFFMVFECLWISVTFCACPQL